MPAENKCPNCGRPVLPDALMGLCPDCMLKAGVGTGGSGSAPAGAFVPLAPAELARYFPQLDILELLGRGGMGAVYKARQRQLDRLVALKILPPGVSHDPLFADRFEREARALAKLHHQNIVTLYEFGHADGLFYFLMEFVDGVNLRQLLNTGKIAPKEALAIVPPICDALQYAHDRGIIHRDIKPENILLSRDGQVKIADFGVAKIVGPEAPETAAAGSAATPPAMTETGRVIGTPQYMAPEQMEHPQDVDHRADIYSLGVVFYQMLTGELPIGRFAPPSRKVQIDVRLDEVVLRALEKEPELRYQHASEVKTQVETIASESGKPEAASQKQSKFANTSLAHAVLVSAGLSGILGTAAFCLFRLFSNPPDVSDWAILVAALLGIFLGIWARKTAFGKVAILVGGIITAIWMAVGIAAQFLNPSPQDFVNWVSSFRSSPSPQPASAEGRSNAQDIVNSVRSVFSSPFRDPSKYLSPFTLVHFDGNDSNKVVVAYDGTEYQLAAIDGLSVTNILDFCRRQYGRSPSVEGWAEKRFSEDLVVVLSDMGHSISADDTVSLTLIDPQTGQQKTIDHAPMTRANRASVFQDRDLVNSNLLGLPKNQNGKPSNDPASAVRSWLSLMDGGAYPQSWEVAAESFHRAVTKEHWVSLSEKVRHPLGGVVSRKEISAQQSSALPGMPDGSYFVEQFATSFAGQTSAVETVTFSLSKDGQWKAIAYLIRPRTAAETAAVSAAQIWLAGIDGGHYAESWTDASEFFRNAITQDKWVAALQSVRAPLGDLKIRTVDSAVTTTMLPGAAYGSYVVMEFHTAFANMNSATETVTFSPEKDGAWRASGYYIK